MRNHQIVNGSVIYISGDDEDVVSKTSSVTEGLTEKQTRETPAASLSNMATVDHHHHHPAGPNHHNHPPSSYNSQYARRLSKSKSSPNGFGIGLASAAPPGTVASANVSPSTTPGASSSSRRHNRDVMSREKSSSSAPSRERLSAFDQATRELSSDRKTLKEITLGRRVGFYRIRGELGTGNFSQVKLAVHTLTKERVAIKIIDKSKLDQKTQKLLSREISNMEQLHHPHIIRLYEVVETLAKVYLVMEFAGGGELYAKICNEGKFVEPQARQVFAQILSAVIHIHAKGIVHRDLKAENVLYAGPGVVKIGDFGFSNKLPAQGMLGTFCGSPPYAAPELFKNKHYEGKPVDQWALGVLLYFMTTASLPFRGDTLGKLKNCILEGDFMLPSYLSAELNSLITRILVQEPQARPSCDDIAVDVWMQNEYLPEPLKEFRLNPEDVFVSKRQRALAATTSGMGAVTHHYSTSSSAPVGGGENKPIVTNVAVKSAVTISGSHTSGGSTSAAAAVAAVTKVADTDVDKIEVLEDNDAVTATTNHRPHVGSTTSSRNSNAGTPPSVTQIPSQHHQRRLQSQPSASSSLHPDDALKTTHEKDDDDNASVVQDPFAEEDENEISSQLNAEEREARRILLELGITAQVILQAKGKQSRSSITGTYRIILHRLQRQALGIYFGDEAAAAAALAAAAAAGGNIPSGAQSLVPSRNSSTMFTNATTTSRASPTSVAGKDRQLDKTTSGRFMQRLARFSRSAKTISANMIMSSSSGGSGGRGTANNVVTPARALHSAAARPYSQSSGTGTTSAATVPGGSPSAAGGDNAVSVAKVQSYAVSDNTGKNNKRGGPQHHFKYKNTVVGPTTKSNTCTLL